MNTKLTFINRSTQKITSRIFLFQKNTLVDFLTFSTAWKVIQNCGAGCSHPFTFPSRFEVSMSDEHGNYSPRIVADNGDILSITPTPTGRRLAITSSKGVPNEVQVLNNLPMGAVNINVFRAGQVIWRFPMVAPQQKAVFSFAPTLWIGMASDIVQGDELSSAIVSTADTEISLLGVASADLVMSGGGPGQAASPIVFSLENVKTR